MAYVTSKIQALRKLYLAGIQLPSAEQAFAAYHRQHGAGFQHHHVVVVAYTLAKVTGERQSFSKIEDDNQGRFHGLDGVVYPCGCIRYNTVLTDGSIGQGEQTEECHEHFFDE